MRLPLASMLTVVALAGVMLAGPISPAAAAPYAPGKILVRLKGGSRERELNLPPGANVRDAVRHLRADPRIAYANPDYVVTAATFPNDPGSSGGPSGWTKDQWNFLPPARWDPGGADVPAAWWNLKTQEKPGAEGITVAVLDTGVAYRRKGRRFRRDPDLPRTRRFIDPRDYVDGDRKPLDEDGHGTHVTSTIAQSTNNRFGLTGIAYGVNVMPVRVLDRRERGRGRNVARGIRYAVRHGADVINLSLEFKPEVRTCGQIVSVCEAVQRATHRGVVVVGAAGNRHSPRVAFPARAPGVIAVGATTYRSCLARYSDYGKGLDLVAPGGGADTALGTTGNDSCDPLSPRYAIRQFSLKPRAAARGVYRKFGIVGLHGTSMAAAHASGLAATLLAIGFRPHRIEPRIERCARQVGSPYFYGAGLLDAGAATGRC
jgi:serine protease